MAVYVDDIRFRRGREVRCHMIADTDRELKAMAQLIGLRPWDHLDAGTPESRYELSMSKRKRALAHGALQLTTPELAMFLAARASRPSSTPELSCTPITQS